MSGIKNALIWFIAEDATPLEDERRQEARQEIRSRLRRNDGGLAIYNEVIPQSRTQLAAMGDLALTVEAIGGTSYHAMTRPVDVASPIIDVNIWAKNISFDVIEEVVDAIRDLLAGYPHNNTATRETGSWGPFGKEVRIGFVSLENEPRVVDSSPPDGSDVWLINYLLTFQIGHSLAVPAT